MKSPLRRIRESHTLTLSDLAIRVNSDVGNLSRIERGVQMPSKELAEKICKELPGLTEMHLFYPERYQEDDPLDGIDATATPDPLPCNLPDDAKVRETTGPVGRMQPNVTKEMT